MVVIWVVICIIDGDMMVICWGDFCFEWLCNRMCVSYNCYFLGIVIVISDVGVLVYICIVLNICIYY